MNNRERIEGMLNEGPMGVCRGKLSEKVGEVLYLEGYVRAA